MSVASPRACLPCYKKSLLKRRSTWYRTNWDRVKHTMIFHGYPYTTPTSVRVWAAEPPVGQVPRGAVGLGRRCGCGFPIGWAACGKANNQHPIEAVYHLFPLNFAEAYYWICHTIWHVSARPSSYILASTWHTTPQQIKQILKLTPFSWGYVKKKQYIYIIWNTSFLHVFHRAKILPHPAPTIVFTARKHLWPGRCRPGRNRVGDVRASYDWRFG